ncbi:hypothetical protein CAAN1_23S00540 [[Candida] anglica]|uniref:Enoyl reductase (ER) domain-containing protein n=1 Tax=[Candida] anglica TaxID=148631 RepID=A0ABP0EDA2_9ASCO
MSTNTAAIATGSTDKNLTTIANVAIPIVPKDGLLVKGVAYATNPTDWKHLVYKMGGKGVRLGSDAAGIVEEVGSNVQDFKKGDYVSTFMRGNINDNNGAFSDYFIAEPNTTIKYNKQSFNNEALKVGKSPSDKLNTFEGAASVTLGLATIGVSLGHHLAIPTDKSVNAGKFILIWGGATATGFLAIQVAKLVYGLKVITTASKKHNESLSSIGADYVFDYNDAEVVNQIKKVGGSNIKYGLDCVSNQETFQALYDATSETSEVNLDNLLCLGAKDIKTDPSRKVKYGDTMVYVVDGNDTQFAGIPVKSSPELVSDYRKFWKNLLPPVMDQIVSTKLRVLKPGFESVEEAFSLLRENKVSCEKIVFRS